MYVVNRHARQVPILTGTQYQITFDRKNFVKVHFVIHMVVSLTFLQNFHHLKNKIIYSQFVFTLYM